MKRIGLMGCGMVADYGHMPALLAADGLDIVSLYDPGEDRLKLFGDKFGVTGLYTDVEEFMNSGIDAVSITSPAPCHLENLRAAAAHGKHVLCEKPLAMAEDESREMVDIAAKAGILLATGFDYRFSEVSQRIKRLADRGVVGDIRSARLIYIWDCHGKYEQRDPANGEQARRTGRMEEGGPLVDCGVHQIDLARWWLGDVRSFSSAGAWVDRFEAPDHVWCHLDHVSGAHTMVEISFSYGHTAKEPVRNFRYELIGTDGVISYIDNDKILEVHTISGIERQEIVSGPKNFPGMYAEFARALSTGELGDLPSGADGLAATAIAREATMSLIRNR